jgi:hypothetical protein
VYFVTGFAKPGGDLAALQSNMLGPTLFENEDLANGDQEM